MGANDRNHHGDAGWDNPQHQAWLSSQREKLLDFYQPEICLPEAGLAYVDNRGRGLPEQGSQLWLGARMIHVFSLAHMLGRAGAADVVNHGLDFYTRGAGFDHEHGGFFACVGGSEPSDRKELYGQAHVVLAGSTATLAGFAAGSDLLDRALDTLDQHFWDEEAGACVEEFDRDFSTLDAYRGQNGNMHLTEAYMAAFEATGDSKLLERAVRIATRITSRAAKDEVGAWRLPEHFNEQWEPVLEFNRDEPRHPFRPYGSQPGHWLEWAKLLMQLQGLGVGEPWMLRAAENLFAGAFQDGWHPTGGFVYTVDWDGKFVVPEKYFWEPAEAIGAARYLHLETGNPLYLTQYGQVWDFTTDHIIDHEHGGWFPELDAENHPVTATWPGKPDAYHAFQALLYGELKENQGLGLYASMAGAKPASYGTPTDPGI